MKSLTKIFMAIVALFAVSCVTDPIEDLGVQLGNDEGQTTTISLSLEETKTHLGTEVDGEYPLYWSKGDKIAVNGKASNALSEEYDGLQSATFKIGGLLNYPRTIVYPAPAEGVTAATAGKYPVTFSATQAYKAGSFAEGAAPMYAYQASSEVAVELQHLSGVLRFAPYGEGVTLNALVVTAESGKLAGNFDVDAEGNLTAHSDALNSVTVTFGEGLALGAAEADATPIYVAVPAGKYGLVTVTLYTDKGSMTRQFQTNNSKISAGVVRVFPAFAFEANGEAGTEFLIYDEASLRNFAANVASIGAGDEMTYTGAKLVANVDMTGKAWTPINNTNEFMLDGGNYAINGLTAPLFGVTSTSFKDLHITNANMTTDLVDAGALACEIESSTATVENCSASGKLTVTLNGAESKAVNKSNSAFAHHIAAIIGYCYSTTTLKNLYTNVDVVLEGTYAARPHTSNGVAYTKGYLDNVVCHGTTTFNGESADGITIIASGVTFAASKGITNCVNGDPNDKSGKKGSINIYGKSGSNICVGGVVGKLTVELDNCHNYGNINLNNQTKGTFVGGIIWEAAANNVVANNCSNHGKITFANTSSGTCYAGAILTQDNGYHLTLNNCTNYGDVEFTEDYTATYLCFGGVAGRIEETNTLLFNGCGNEGDILFNGEVTTGYIQLSGGIGCLQTIDKDGKRTAPELSIQNGITNNGDITVNGSVGGNARIGGLFGVYTQGLGGTNSGNIYNRGNIVCTITGSPSIAVGGVYGAIGKSVMGSSVKPYNEGDITANISLAEDQLLYVGGIVGYISQAAVYIGNSRCFCNIVAPGATGAGMITGIQRNPVNSGTKSNVRSCSAGGTILRGTDTEAVTLTSSNYGTYLYGVAVEPSTLVTVDDTSYYISAIDATRQSPPTGEINSMADFKKFVENVATHKNVVLNVDLDMSEWEGDWTPIEGYTGVFDGRGHKIKGLTAPLFGDVALSSIENLHLTDVNIVETSNTVVGALARQVNNVEAVIRNCSAEGTLTLSSDSFASSGIVGGLVGATTTALDMTGLVNKLAITISGKSTAGGHFAGCVASTNSALVDCHNLGTINFELQSSGNLYIGGVTTRSTALKRCMNGAADDTTHQKGSITYTGNAKGQLMVGGVSATVSPNSGYTMTEVSDCCNYANLTVGGTHNSSNTGSVAGIACHSGSIKGVLTRCKNYGNFTISVKMNTTKKNFFVGGIANMSTAGLTEYTYCQNYGNIHVTEEASFMNNLLIGGVANVLAYTTIYKDLANYGEVKVDGTVNAILQLGGVAGRLNNQTTVSGSLANYGSVVCNGTITANGYVGGVLGIVDLDKDTGATFADDLVVTNNGGNKQNPNQGKVVFKGTGSSGIYVGGLFGGNQINLNINAKNTGNIVSTGTATSGVYVGGIFGAHPTADGTIHGARCYCTITVPEASNVGFITGRPYNVERLITNCHIGGYIANEEGGDRTKIEDYDFHRYIYGDRMCQKEDILPTYCGWLENSINDTPIDVDGAEME